uniref:Uncharacterized protein n=1 Tax=Plectus sambesii TaxID=2011161 RepID=A0A914VIB3_9BILA
TFKPNIQLVGSLPDLVRAGTEIMCMVRRIDAETMLPVVVWYPSTEMRHFERRVALDSSPASFQPNITPVEGEAADVFVVWLTAEKSARFTYSVVFGNATSVNENAPFFRFQKQLLEVQRIASECAPWDWRRGAPAVGAKLLYECDGVRSNIQKMGPAWVRAVVSSVHFDASQSSWQVVVSLLDMGDRKVVITGQHLFTRLRVWCHQLDKFDSQPPLVVVTCRLQGYETNADMRMDKEGFAFMQHLNDSVAFFMRREVDGGGDVVYETVMWGTDWR